MSSPEYVIEYDSSILKSKLGDVSRANQYLDDPGGQTNGRVGKAKRQCLWLCALDPLIARFINRPALHACEIFSFLGRLWLALLPRRCPGSVDANNAVG